MMVSGRNSVSLVGDAVDVVISGSLEAEVELEARPHQRPGFVHSVIVIW